ARIRNRRGDPVRWAANAPRHRLPRHRRQEKHSVGCMDIKTIKEYLTGLQDWIVGRLEEMDGNPFRRDSWDRPGGGGGMSCLTEEGNLFERGGVNFSHVTGSSLPPSATVSRS